MLLAVGCGPAVSESGSGDTTGSTGPGTSSGPGPTGPSTTQADTSSAESGGSSSTSGVDGSSSTGAPIVPTCAVVSSIPELGGALRTWSADVDGDGVTDIWRQDEDDAGGFVVAGFELVPGSPAVAVSGGTLNVPVAEFADVDGDGFDDALLYLDDGFGFIRGDGDGLGALSVPLDGVPNLGAGLEDFDGDGDLDVLGGSFDGLVLYEGDGLGAFTPSAAVDVPIEPYWAGAGGGNRIWVLSTDPCLGFCDTRATWTALDWVHPGLQSVSSTPAIESKPGGTTVSVLGALEADATPRLVVQVGEQLELWSGGETVQREVLRDDARSAAVGDFDGDDALDVLSVSPAGLASVAWGTARALVDFEDVEGAVPPLTSVAGLVDDDRDGVVTYDAGARGVVVLGPCR